MHGNNYIRDVVWSNPCGYPVFIKSSLNSLVIKAEFLTDLSEAFEFNSLADGLRAESYGFNYLESEFSMKLNFVFSEIPLGRFSPPMSLLKAS